MKTLRSLIELVSSTFFGRRSSPESVSDTPRDAADVRILENRTSQVQAFKARHNAVTPRKVCLSIPLVVNGRLTKDRPRIDSSSDGLPSLSRLDTGVSLEPNLLDETLQPFWVDMLSVRYGKRLEPIGSGNKA